MTPPPALSSAHPDPRPAGHTSAGGRLVATDGRALPLASAALGADACGGIARVTLEQVFRNPYDEPLRLTYALALPADAAVSGFSFQIGEERVVGEVARRSAARERFEQALVEGHSAGLLEQDRSSVFRQELGNIPARTDVRVQVALDQQLAWSGDGAWEWRFPTVVAPRYLGAAGRVADAERIAVEVRESDAGPRMALDLVVRDAIVGDGRPTSPSHALAVSSGGGEARVGLGEAGGARLDRDVVVRWPVALPTVGVSLDRGRPGLDRPHSHCAYGLLTLVPPAPEAAAEPVARDLIVLIDTSGSMAGPPLAQAQRVVCALIDTLTGCDRIELIAFSSRPERFRRRPLAADAKGRREARAWVAALVARGATEMQAGIREALRPLRAEAQRQIVLVTDGLIGFEDEIVDTLVRELPQGSRLHALGVGSAVNTSLIGPAARAGRGSHAIVGLDEEVDAVVRRMVAATTAPLLVDVELTGGALRGVAPVRLPDLYAGRPARVGVAVDPEGGEIVLRGRTPGGSFSQTIAVPATEAGAGHAAAVALYGRERVEDLEMRSASGRDRAACEAEIEQIGLDFQIATRLTSWVAVSERATVDPREPSRRERVPQAVAYGLSVEGLGLRGATGPFGLPMPGARPWAAARPRAFYELLLPDLRKPSPFSTRSPRHGRRVDATRAPLDAGRRGAEGPASSRRVLRGKLVYRSEELAVFEVELELALAWELPAAVLVSRDGEPVLEVELDAAKSTRSGPLEPGQVLRLALRLPASAGSVDRIVVRGAGGFVLLLDRG